MLSPARMSMLPGGVRELAASSRTGSLCRSGALISSKYGKSLEQRRTITIEQLDKARDSKYSPLPTSSQDNTFLWQEETSFTDNLLRPRARNYSRIRMGRFHSRALSRLLKIPNSGRISPFLLRLHPSPGVHRCRHAGIPNCARTRAEPTNESRLLSGMG
jgi:hypothetical protein